MKKQTLKAIWIMLIGLIIWIGFMYIAIAFVKNESNPYMWSEDIRTLMMSFFFIYCVFFPVIVRELKNYL